MRCGKDLLRIPGPELPREKAIEAARDWLIQSQKTNGDGGSSKAFYLLSNKWAVSYPETSGYIISTFMDLYNLYGNEEDKVVATELAEWLLTIQTTEGAFPALDLKMPVVFDTGQILLGLTDLYEIESKPAYADAIHRAATWLVNQQTPAGTWRDDYSNTDHAYNSRVGWAMVKAGQLLNQSTYQEAGMRNLDWVVSQQKENGWFHHNGFIDHARPILHTIVYAARGLLEGHALQPEKEQYLLAARRTGDVLMDIYRTEQRLHGAYDEQWRIVSQARCLVGEAQLAVLWMRLYELLQVEGYRQSAKKVITDLTRTQDITTANKGIYGGIKGSIPVFAHYMLLSYPNWATKFYLDALLLEKCIAEKLCK
jgi:uncharacterized protein YyaL (SSP411 family)